MIFMVLNSINNHFYISLNYPQKRMNIRCFKRMLRGRGTIRHNLRSPHQLNLNRCPTFVYISMPFESVSPLTNSNGAGDLIG